MNAKRKFCLEFLATKEGTGRMISQSAADAGANPNASPEWADLTLRELRKTEMIEYTGKTDNGAKIHRITGKGRDALQTAKAGA